MWHYWFIESERRMMKIVMKFAQQFSLSVSFFLSVCGIRRALTLCYNSFTLLLSLFLNPLWDTFSSMVSIFAPFYLTYLHLCFSHFRAGNVIIRYLNFVESITKDDEIYYIVIARITMSIVLKKFKSDMNNKRLGRSKNRWKFIKFLEAQEIFLRFVCSFLTVFQVVNYVGKQSSEWWWGCWNWRPSSS